MTAPELEVLTFPSWRELRRRLPQVVLGNLVMAPGIALIVNAGLGVSPYDVLHQGVARTTGISFGAAVVLVGLLILVLWIPIGQRLGLGTIVSVVSVGPLVDLTFHLLPEPGELELRWPMLLGGTVLTALGIGLYIGGGLGPGPRDGLMTGIAAKGHALWAVRTVIELTSFGIGWALGGDIGVGTVIYAFSIGPLAHYFLKRLHLGVRGVDPDPQAALGE